MESIDFCSFKFPEYWYIYFKPLSQKLIKLEGGGDEVARI